MDRGSKRRQVKPLADSLLEALDYDSSDDSDFEVGDASGNLFIFPQFFLFIKWIHLFLVTIVTIRTFGLFVHTAESHFRLAPAWIFSPFMETAAVEMRPSSLLPCLIRPPAMRYLHWTQYATVSYYHDRLEVNTKLSHQAPVYKVQPIMKF